MDPDLGALDVVQEPLPLVGEQDGEDSIKLYPIKLCFFFFCLKGTHANVINYKNRISIQKQLDNHVLL